MWKKLVSVGEARLNQLASNVVSNEAIIDGLGDLLKMALGAKEQAVTTVKAGLKLLNVPSLDDIARLESKLDDIEAVFNDIRDVLDARDNKPNDVN